MDPGWAVGLGPLGSVEATSLGEKEGVGGELREQPTTEHPPLPASWGTERKLSQGRAPAHSSNLVPSPKSSGCKGQER